MSAARRPSIALRDDRPIWQSLAIFVLPLMLSNLLQSLGQTANAIYLGRLVGVGALASVSAIFPIVFFLTSFVIGLGAGSSVLIGQAHGARNEARMREIAGTAIAATLVLGTLVAIVGATFARGMLALLGTPADIIDVSTSYARITFCSIPLLFAFLMYTTFLRGTGDTRTPLVVLIASTALTFALTPLFIAGVGPLHGLGTNGAAIANLCTNAVSLAGMGWYLRRTHHPLAIDRQMLGHIRLRPKLVATIARIGIPTSLNVVMVSLSEIAVLSFVNRFGSTALAAYGAVNQIVNYVQFPAISLGIAVSIFGAQSIGAGLQHRIATIVRSGVVLNYAIEGGLILIVYASATSVLSLFVASSETIAIAHRLLAITLWSYALFGNARVLSAIMISSGSVVWPTLLSIFSIWGVEVPVAYVLMGRLGIDGVWYGYPAAYAAGLLFQTLYYLIIWRNRPIVRLV